MDAASAAAMSDPDRNPNFRRRWNDDVESGASPASRVAAIGTLGVALEEEMQRRRRAEQAQAVGSSKGEPPR